MEALSFSFANFKIVDELKKTKKKALANVLRTKSILPIEMKRKATLMVDVDD